MTNNYVKHTLEEAKKVIRKWLYITDPDALDIVFAVGISEQLPGDPLWLFLIAPPGGCKTEILRAFEGEQYYHLSDLTSKTFVSGLMLGQGKERRKIDDLLPQLDRKTLIFKDFTTALEKGREERQEIFAQLREIYDGRFAKKFGSIDEKVEYFVRFGLIAGVTPIIDKHWKLMQQLGERFLKYRWDEDEDATTRKAEANEGQEAEMRVDIEEAVMGFLSFLDVQEPTFPPELVEPLILAAKFLANIRTPVTIHAGHSDFYFDFIPTPERPTRLVKQLKRLAKALAVVRSHPAVTEADIETAIKVALSTAPPDRLAVLQAIQTQQHATLDGCTITQIGKIVALPETSIRNITKQLHMLSMIRENKVRRETGTGWESAITYYQLSEKVTALTPPTLLEASRTVKGEGAGGLE